MFDSRKQYVDMLSYLETALSVNGEAIINCPATAKVIAEKWEEEYRSGICRSLWGIRPVEGRPFLYEAYKIA